ncbi:MAG: hypothetical protein GIX02_11245 [Candidatus Eremiobacteraeota bacterium]|nr:hypothetical protein [Candidatus Eremiobacteraeota bacterium]
MKHRHALFALLLTLGFWTTAPAVLAAAMAPKPSASERIFVDRVSRDLTSRFSTTAAAARAGYYRYTDPDESGAISWVNPRYWQSDAAHPSQLWYDVSGRLIGADFSVLQSQSAAAPSMWGVASSRWTTFEPHVHYGIKGPDGKLTFGALGPKSISKAGGTAAHPTAQDIVRANKAKNVDDVAFVFAFPSIWDLQVWVIPNPNGAFAELNPNVKPSKSSQSQM